MEYNKIRELIIKTLSTIIDHDEILIINDEIGIANIIHDIQNYKHYSDEYNYSSCSSEFILDLLAGKLSLQILKRSDPLQFFIFEDIIKILTDIKIKIFHESISSQLQVKDEPKRKTQKI